MQEAKKSKIEVPVWEKLNLSIEEAAVYSNIGIIKIRELLKSPSCTFVLRIGNKKVVKRKEFEEYLQNQVNI